MKVELLFPAPDVRYAAGHYLVSLMRKRFSNTREGRFAESNQMSYHVEALWIREMLEYAIRVVFNITEEQYVLLRMKIDSPERLRIVDA